MIKTFLFGMTAAFAATIGLFFFRFWRQSRDRLFAYFGAAFALLAVERSLHGLGAGNHESDHLIYLVRLPAFVLILVGIVDKNRGAASPPRKG